MPIGSKAADCMLLRRQLQEAVPYRPIARLLSRPYADPRPARIPKGRKCNATRQHNHEAPQPTLDYNSCP